MTREHKTKIRCLGIEKQKLKLLHLVNGIIVSLKVANESVEKLGEF